MTTTPLRRRTAAIAAALVSAVLVLTACSSDGDDPGGADTSGGTRSFEADNGTVEIPVDPQRIVALGNAVGPVIDLGVEPVGVSESVFFANAATWFSAEETAAYESAEQVGGRDLDIEAIAALDPDLIVAAAPPQALEQNYAPIEERLQSIAPTVFIENSTEEWKTQEGRLADAVGLSEAYEPLLQEYDALVEGMREEFASEIESLSFVQLVRYANTPEGQISMSPAGQYASRYPTEVGFEFAECADGGISCEFSMEQLSDLVGEYDVLLYPLGPDGEPTVDFAPVTESNVWSSLPQVVDERALGIEGPQNVLIAHQAIGYLTSLSDALRGLAD